ncbi:sorbosone dehydrogenase family protein [Methylobacterium sp. WL30]|uniref:PQQ-dependent sugar dehydrogenase n=1 Tax=unclassified Methylobacterium TaxID=2615210 RepID=UPI0011C88380|nr:MULTISPECIES: PQQ-dependent sugar dehydrogenase [unclassified Methylobacterium]TXN40560.1 sorbosone dehydrogenase family protein [Methylobacterium sp. WL93]TXN49665.1 sorbosone dehydrogenase family protein [Methylobacterium sp. WL119]TXN66153.1 sorbosone dehydrogenase family protein [Methylobacterium sp. WL30]
MPITATPVDKLPLDKLHLPDGFKLEVYASGLANGRTMQLGDKGTLFVGTRIAGRVYAVTDRDGKREVKIIAKGLHRPNGVAFHDGTLYVAEISKISKFPDIEANLDHPPAPVSVYEDLPKDEAHGWKFIKVGPDGKLYVPVGSPGNSLIPPDTHAQIRRMDLDGKNVEVVARGVRNTVGFDWNPKTRQLWFTDNGRDWISEDLPNDELNVLAEPGKQHFGFPYCHQGNFTDPEYGWGHSCDEFTAPVALLGAHTASLGMRFSSGSQFPDAYRNGIFIAQHGSWNRTKKSGGQVVFAKLDDSGKVVSVEPFLTGFLENNDLIGRPVDVQVAPDGTLLVSDDLNGAIYRISYDANAKHASR